MSDVLPTSAQAIAWCASALRLANIRGGTSDFSESTTKRIAAGDPSVSDEKAGALLAALVDGLFTPALLEARGLAAANGAADHQAILVAGLEGALAVWDRFVSLVNIADERHKELLQQFAGSVALGDIAARLAAYLTLYGHAVPVARRVQTWAARPGIAVALAQLRERAPDQPSDGRLCRIAKIQPHTFRDLRTGRHLPKEDTLLRLSRALVQCQVDGGTTTDEITFEMRFACLAACLRAALVARPEISAIMSFAAGTLRFLLYDLRRYSSVELGEIVTLGTRWSRWPEVHERMKQVCAGDLLRMVESMRHDAARTEVELGRVATEDPKAALQLCAEHLRKLAHQVASAPLAERSTGAEVAALLKNGAELLSAVAEEQSLPPLHRLDDAFEAMCLCDQALAPWNDFAPDQREALYKRAAEMAPACASVCFRYASFLLEDAARLDEAIAHLRTATALDEGYVEARHALARCLLRAGRQKEVLEEVAVLERQDGRCAETLRLRGAALLGLGRLNEARESFEHILEESPHHAGAHEGLAEVLNALGYTRAARSHRRKAEMLLGTRPPQVLAPQLHRDR